MIEDTREKYNEKTQEEIAWIIKNKIFLTFLIYFYLFSFFYTDFIENTLFKIKFNFFSFSNLKKIFNIKIIIFFFCCEGNDSRKK
jgi:hypothetical protein